MPCFLNIPRELRDQIYELVLDSPNAAPSSPKCYQGNSAELLKHETPYIELSYCNYAPRDLPLSASRSLLRLNHQVRDETLAMLSHLTTTRGSRYVLDIMIEDEVRLYPTWLLIPCSPAVNPHIDTVSVTFRIFGDMREQRSGWEISDSGPGETVWGLHALIQRFLSYGPEWRGRCRLAQYPIITLGTLDLNVLSPPAPVEGAFRATLRRRSEDTGTLHPKAVVSAMRFGMDILLSRAEEAEAHGRLLYERVQRVRLSLDGKVRKVWDLSVLAAMEVTDPDRGVRLPDNQEPSEGQT
ncbi:hypothetical protein W97_00608 [Coniosporium apollinis CBS 100218]|uniref:Uncharacterized protein n=1 Tax=Coniosporium apollinis (strain CBS 100218) TaxID=1168221 RepID=R7YHV7_CONA1|nr:uncharacterized protein W97_00608 [Coniosporium apollinis CBS 100218]EON61394.1 hypothetical protein W97_00608 [Coniosporium apollinis CBS 100218]